MHFAARLKSSPWFLGVGVGAVLVSITLAACQVLPSAWGQPLEPDVTIPPEELAKGVSVLESITVAPLDQLILLDDVAIAIVEPLSREAIQIISPDERAEYGISVEGIYQGEWPLTPVTVRVIETLKGDLPTIIHVWENRGGLPNLEVDSNDPFLSPGERGLLLMSVHTARIRPIIFAPMAEGGYMPFLEMTLDEFRTLLKEKL